MLLAYLRGLLRPGYVQGIRSQVREEVILAALDKEQQAAYNADLLALDASMLIKIKPEAADRHYKRLGEAAFQIANMREFLDTGSKNKSNLSSIDASIKLFHALEKAGIIK